MELKEEQKAVIFHDEGDLLVSASAGSGKTFTMIRRLIRLIVEKKAKVGEILAVTFTEKAAAEMKSKLLDALLKEIAGGNDLLKSQISDVYTADICTVHAFCGRILRKYFFEAGLSPDFEVADEVLSGDLKEKVLSELFEKKYGEDGGFAMLAARHSRRRRDGELKDTILSLYEYARSEADFSASLSAAAEQYTEEKARYFYDELVREPLERYAYFEKRFSEYAAEFSSLGETKCAEYAAILSSAARERVTDKETLPSLPRKCGTEEGSLVKERLRREREPFFAAMEEYAALGGREEETCRFLSCREHTVELVKLTEEFAAAYESEKREQNVLDFSDLEHLALKLLGDEKVLADIRGKYRYVFADEYQDTNGVQEAIFRAVSDGNLFMVGDLKQSIYAFRGCNPALFAEQEKRLNAAGGVKYLNHNFRSAPEVIENVNRIFDYCMKADFSGVDYTRSRLVTGGTYGEHRGRFSFDVLRTDGGKEEKNTPHGVYDVLEHPFGDGEDFTAGDFLADLIEEEIGMPYYDVEEKSERRVRYGDIAVLVRSRNRFTERLVRRLLARGIPVEAESGSVTDYAEIRALIDALKLADNFRQDIPLCSALKNLFAFSDEDLAEIRLFANDKLKGKKEITFFDAYACCKESYGGELSRRLRDADARFGKLALYGEQAGAGGFLRAVLGETSLELKIAASPDGERKLRRVERFVAEADAYGCTVREFLRRIERSDGEMDLSEAAGEDSVRFVTMHASKGLEYPVVFVAGIDNRFNIADSTARIVKKRGYGFAVPAYDDENKTVSDTVFRRYLKREVHKETVREEMRLFYVALTRAKYSLHIVGVDTVPGIEETARAGKYAHFLPPDLPVKEYGAQNFAANEPRSAQKIFIGSGDARLEEMIGKNLSFEYPYLADTELKLKTSVTAAAAKNEEDEYNYLDLGEETTTERGTAMHKFLENYAFDGTDAKEELERQKKNGLISEEDAARLDLAALEKLLAGGVFDMLKGFELYKEQWFMVNVPPRLVGMDGGEIMLQGILDLLAVKDGEAIIVDYKYSSKDAESLKKTYRRQLELYKYAVERALGLKVTATYLVSLAEAKAFPV